jgi:drug/metabolite transporter (DMT)-like permease
VHLAFYRALAFGYGLGFLPLVYRIGRGSAPPVVALAAWAFAGESLSPAGVLAIVVISGGIVSLAFTGGWRVASVKPVAFALATGLAIAGYTLCDGLGGRAAGDVFGYIAWLFVLDAVPFTLLVAWRRRAVLGSVLAVSWRPAALGGVLSVGAYALVIWAMTVSRMASVSALRETSVILAALIGTRLLREPFGARRIAAASAVACGIMLLQVSRAA